MCPDWNNYNNHNGVDFRVFQRCKEILAIECKNWRKIGRIYDSQIAQTEIINRFNHVGTSLKLCIITFTDLLCSSGLKLIESNGISLIETNKLIGHRDYKNPLFYTIKQAIQNLINQQQKPQANPDYSILPNTLTNYYSISNIEYSKQSSTIPSMIQSTIPTIDIDSHIVSSNPVVALLQEARRRKKLQDSFAEHGLILNW
jgi:hypothetical protein